MLGHVRHGLRATLAPTGFAVEGPRTGAPTVVTDVRGADGSILGAVYGPVSTIEARSIVARLTMGGDPGGPDVPWIAVARSGATGLAACASTMLTSGLFWRASGDKLVVASDPAAARSTSNEICPEYVHDFAGGVVAAAATPYRGVSRTPAGTTALWMDPHATPILRQWCGPQVWGEPTLDGADAVKLYLEAFDGVVAELASRASSLVSTVSGGLDSTFIAATLAQGASGESPVLGLTYAPLAAACLESHGRVDADETWLARTLEAAYPDRLVIEQVTNSSLTRPLEAAASAARRAGVPTFNPANQPWLSAMQERAAAVGAGMLFVGRNGNAAFSHDHLYAADYYLRGRQWRRLASLGRDSEERWRFRAIRTRILGPLRRRHLAGSVPARHPLAPFGIDGMAHRPPEDRAHFLAWLARTSDGLTAATNPAAHNGILLVDPFNSRAVLDVAAAISPSEWQRGGEPRGFARRAGVGRVPDQIRLRTGRGQQGRDAWYVIRHDRNEYLDRIADVSSISGLEHVDARALLAHVADWPWGSIQGPPWPELVAVDRLLSVADFAGRAGTSGWGPDIDLPC